MPILKLTPWLLLAGFIVSFVAVFVLRPWMVFAAISLLIAGILFEIARTGRA